MGHKDTIFLATGGYRTFSEEKGPKELSDSIRYALGIRNLMLWPVVGAGDSSGGA